MISALSWKINLITIFIRAAHWILAWAKHMWATIRRIWIPPKIHPHFASNIFHPSVRIGMLCALSYLNSTPHTAPNPSRLSTISSNKWKSIDKYALFCSCYLRSCLQSPPHFFEVQIFSSAPVFKQSWTSLCPLYAEWETKLHSQTE